MHNVIKMNGTFSGEATLIILLFYSHAQWSKLVKVRFLSVRSKFFPVSRPQFDGTLSSRKAYRKSYLCKNIEQMLVQGEELNKHSCFRSDPIVCFMLVSCSPCNHVQFI